MVDKRTDIEKALTKLSTARDRIAQQLEESEAQVKLLQEVVNSALLESGETNHLSELSINRERVNSLHQALQYANGQVNQARQALEDHDRAAQGGIIMDMDKKVQQAIVNLQAKIGEAGLKAEVDKLGEMIAELERLSNSGVQVIDVAEHCYSAKNIHDRLSRSLLASWQDIEGLGWGQAHSQASSRPNYIEGFGVRPGNLISS